MLQPYFHSTTSFGEMGKLKFRKARVRGQRGYWVVPFEGSEIADLQPK